MPIPRAIAVKRKWQKGTLAYLESLMICLLWVGLRLALPGVHSVIQVLLTKNGFLSQSCTDISIVICFWRFPKYLIRKSAELLLLYAIYILVKKQKRLKSFRGDEFKVFVKVFQTDLLEMF